MAMLRKFNKYGTAQVLRGRFQFSTVHYPLSVCSRCFAISSRTHPKTTCVFFFERVKRAIIKVYENRMVVYQNEMNVYQNKIRTNDAAGNGERQLKAISEVDIGR